MVRLHLAFKSESSVQQCSVQFLLRINAEQSEKHCLVPAQPLREKPAEELLGLTSDHARHFTLAREISFEASGTSLTHGWTVESALVATMEASNSVSVGGCRLVKGTWLYFKAQWGQRTNSASADRFPCRNNLSQC